MWNSALQYFLEITPDFHVAAREFFMGDTKGKKEKAKDKKQKEVKKEKQKKGK
ncbi:hypothetical protein JCM31598_00620 [Desulfonatronum parangueonense]